MYCPKCGAVCGSGALLCTECGAPFPKKAKKGSLWPPLIFMAVMLAVGIAVYTAYPEGAAETGAPGFVIENGCLTFDESAYSGSTQPSVPEGVTALAEDCFRDCDSLDTVHLPDSLTVIGDRAFAQCDGLRGLKLRQGVTHIGAGAFHGCTALEAITVPASVESVGIGAFDGCTALRHIFFEGTKGQWNALNVADFGSETTIYCTDGTLKPNEPNP